MTVTQYHAQFPIPNWDEDADPQAVCHAHSENLMFADTAHPITCRNCLNIIRRQEHSRARQLAGLPPTNDVLRLVGAGWDE